ncbi:hypothetical protein [Priestia megaterium]
MATLVELEIKRESQTYEGKEIKLLNAYAYGELFTEAGATLVPFIERALNTLADIEITLGTQEALDVQVKLPYAVSKAIKKDIVAKFTADPIFNSITFKN